MSSFLWLLLYLAPLLGLTAALFAWLGWWWRSTDLQQRIDGLAAQLEAAQEALRQARAATPEPAATTTAREPAAAAEDRARLEHAEAELQALRSTLAAAQAEARLRQDEAAKAREAALALETETSRLLADLDHLSAAHHAAQQELDALRSAPPAAPAADADAPAGKGRRKRAASAKPSASQPAVPLREKLATLEAGLSAQQAGLSTLTQERDGWQRRIGELQEAEPPDPAGLGLARRSLADSEKRLASALVEIQRLQNHARALRRAEESSAAFADAPDDDLTQIKGIKKIISEQLRAHGVRTWRQIALWDDDDLRAFGDLLAFKNRATREQWREQARALHEAVRGPLP